MEKKVILAELKALLASAPDFNLYSETSVTHITWLAKAHALVAKEDPGAAITLRTATDFMPIHIGRPTNVAQVFSVIHRTVAALEIDVGENGGGAFGPGAVYDFLRALRDILQAASSEVFIVDPYLNAEVFDTYVSGVAAHAKVRLFLQDRDPSFKPALAKYVAQYPNRVDARESKKLHDRVVFVDRSSCWLLGQSIKDAARRGPTYIAPISADIVPLKLADYEALWSVATPL
ncbi:MAG: hypothetical protein H3C62_09625 [Gemmatimonadaceae bacterium]|nr:hypothetical protein [Gemmatimonadaceae bacterium]